METSNENTASNFAFNTRFNIFQHSRFQGIRPSNCPFYDCDDKEEGAIDYSTRASISRSKSSDNEPNIIKRNIRDYMEEVTSTLHEQGEVQSSTSIITSSKGKNTAGRYVSNKDGAFNTDAWLPKTLEKEILRHKSIFKESRKIEKYDIAREQREKDLLILNHGPKNQMSSGVAYRVSKNMNSEFFQGEELFSPIDANNAMGVPSSTDVQRHLNDRRYVCTECGKDFRQKHHLVSHYLTHTGEKPFDCEKCGKSFSHLYNLNTHRRIHTEEKPFSCDKCGKRFSRSDHLARHCRIHTAEKPFACDKCEKRFSRSDTLASHRRIHTKENPFACNKCEKTSSLSNGLSRYRRTHTRENYVRKNLPKAVVEKGIARMGMIGIKPF